MPHLNYMNLSPDDFERLAQDIMQRVLGVKLHRYTPGPDDGIDLCNNIKTNEIVVQCKRIDDAANLINKLRNVEKNKIENLYPRPKRYYVFTSAGLTPNRKKEVLNLFSDYMQSEENIIDRIAIEEFFNNEENHDLILRHKALFESYPPNYRPENSNQLTPKDCRDRLLNLADEKRKRIKSDLLFPWFPDSVQYHDVFPKLFITPQLKATKTQKYVQSVAYYIRKNLIILGNAGAGKTTYLKIQYSYKLTRYKKAKDTICLFFHASDFMEDDVHVSEKKPGELYESLELARKDPETHYLFLIDGIDEAFSNKPHDYYRSFISKLKSIPNCNYWLGCRKDFYISHLDERTHISDNDLTIEAWTDEMVSSFIRIYSRKRKKDLTSIIYTITKKAPDSSSIEQMMRNPFQLSILTFIAEECFSEKDEESNIAVVRGVYDLYEQFLLHWIRHEKMRGTSSADDAQISIALHDAARKIYSARNYVLNSEVQRISAVRGLLKIKKRVDGTELSNEFYHRSLAEFLMANEAFQSVYDNDGDTFISICRIKLKDDITNFICDKFSTLNSSERQLIKNHLKGIYHKTEDAVEWLSIREQIIYFITRLEIDVSDFINDIMAYAENNTMIKMTLAYGCALQENSVTRRYALEFAKAIVDNPQGDEAIVNRSWAVIYYGDIHSEDLDMNEYEYRDTQKGPWAKVRKSRTDRFERKPLRRKDMRFLILDIPLFHNFLIDRDWDQISNEEFLIIDGIPVDDKIYSEEEYRFIITEKASLIKDYQEHLKNLI